MSFVIDCDFDLVHPMQKTFEIENRFVFKFDISITDCFELLAGKI